ncbi:MAG TPA: cyanophycin synthetase [Polyangiaceae bacterium]
MQICKLNRLVGPNIWANYPVIEVWVDLGKYEDFPSNTLPGFNDKLMAWLPTMIEHRCTIGDRGGFFERLRTGTWLGHVLEHVTLEIQSLAHLPVGFGRAREQTDRGVYKVAIEVLDFRFGEACIRVAHDMVMAAAEGRDFGFPAALKQLRVNADDFCYGPSTQAIVDAAKARAIPMLRLTEGNLVQLGYGKAQRRIWTAETDSTSAVAESIAHDKELTRNLLASVGVPIPEGRAASSPEDAWKAAEELGLPVVVKPQNGNKGRGVSIRLEDRASIEAAYSIAEKQEDASGVVVEKFIPGRPFRVLVVGERAVAASGGQPHQLIGDGAHTVDQLAALANQDPQRGDDSAQPLMPFVIDDIALESLRRQGLTRSSVPAANSAVILRHNGDLTVDETDRMHPEVAAQCVLAVRTIGLDVAGIDLIAEDIGKPLDKQGGALIEVNSSPGLIMHLKPQVGSPRPVGEAIVAQLFAAGQTGRVPLVAVSGTNGKTLVTELISEMLRATGATVGRASSEGLRVGTRALGSGDRANAESMRRALMNPYADAFVFEVSEPAVIDEGLIFDQCQVAIVTNAGSWDHLGKKYADEVLLGKAVRAPVDIVLPTGFAVLNADDPAVLEFAKFCKGKVVLFATSEDSPGIAEHLAADGRAVIRSGERVVLAHGKRREPLIELAALSCPELGLPDFLVGDLLAAVGGAVALNLSHEQIQAGVNAAVGQGGIAVFDLPVTPARPNGGVAIVTPSRNPSAFHAWAEHFRNAYPGYKAEVLVEPAADWRGSDAVATAELLNQCFSRVTLALNATEGAFVEALETLGPPPNCRLMGRSTPLMDVLDQLLEGVGAADLLCVCPSNAAGFAKILGHLDAKGVSRRRVGGLASVRHCR